jgi:hypothetical protein
MPRWALSHRADPVARDIADRHYNRQKIGAKQFVPPGRCIVLVTDRQDAFWITSFPIADYVQHAWPGAMVCTAFRNEGDYLSSDLIAEAVAISRWKWPELHPLGMVSFVNADKVRRKRDPGRCFKRAGWTHVGFTKAGLWAYQILPEDMPEAIEPLPYPGENPPPMARINGGSKMLAVIDTFRWPAPVGQPEGWA